nr:MAG TPA: hypothetical protein [Caudoviricetes sp.]
MSAPTAWQLLYCWRVDMRKLTNKKNTHTADQLSNLHRGFSKNSDR